MKTFIFILFILLPSIFPAEELKCSIVVSEIMPSPANGEPEWIELCNTANEAISFDSLEICDAVSCKKIGKITFPPNSFTVFCSDTAFLIDKYDLIIPRIMFQSTLPILNNTSDEVKIRNGIVELIDSCYYDQKWGIAGKSLERKKLDLPALSSENWLASTDSSGATPCRENSNSNTKCTLIIISFVQSKDWLKYTIHSTCNQSASIRLSADLDKSHSFEFNEMKLEKDYFIAENTSISDSLLIAEIFSSALKGRYYLQLDLFDDDDNQADDSQLAIQLNIAKSDVLINEIMPEPAEYSCEYIELFNNFSDTLDLGGWQIFDAAGSFDKKSIVMKSLLVPPNAYFTIAADSSIFEQFPHLRYSPNLAIIKSSVSLGNTSDVLVLCDDLGATIDSLSYSSKWHNSSISSPKGISLERISANNETNIPENWSSSSSSLGGSPCQTNSFSENSMKGNITISPNPFHTRLSAGECRIIYELPFNNSRLRAIIFSEDGLQIAEPANNVFAHSAGEIFWNGKDSKGNSLPDGIYILFLEAVNTENDAVFSEKAVIVLKN